VTVGHGVFRGFQDTRTPFVITLTLNLVNLVLDPLLIFVAGWGITGAAVATLIAQWVGAGWFVLLFRRNAWLRVGSVPAPSQLLPFLAVGGALIARSAALVGVLTFATATAASVGTEIVAAHQVLLQWMLFLSLIVDSLAIAAQAMIGRFRGAGDGPAIRRVAAQLLRWGLVVGLVLAGGLLAFRRAIASGFTESAEVGALIADSLPILALMQPVASLVFVADGLYLGAAAFRFLAVATVGASALAALLLVGATSAGLGLAGIWWALTALMAARGAAFIARYRSRAVIG
jgi:MATE family multidrug resistance protein